MPPIGLGEAKKLRAPLQASPTEATHVQRRFTRDVSRIALSSFALTGRKILAVVEISEAGLREMREAQNVDELNLLRNLMRHL